MLLYTSYGHKGSNGNGNGNGKGKGKVKHIVHPIAGHEGQEVKQRYSSPLSLTLSLDEVDRIPVGARFSARPDRPWCPPSLLGAGSFPGVKSGRGVTLTTPPLLAPRSWKSRAIPLPPYGPQPGL